MGRPLKRDVLAWWCGLPASTLLVVCLFLPQVRTCEGQVETPRDNGSAVFLIALAVLALAPLLWRARPLRRPLTILVSLVFAMATVGSVLGIGVAIYCALVRPWRSAEDWTAFAASCLAMMFVVVFPLVGLFGTWLDGAKLAWGAGWVTMLGAFAWSSAARDRVFLRDATSVATVGAVPLVIDRPRDEAPPVRDVPRFIGDYEIERALGEGGMARVYRGRHRTHGTVHALKVLDPSYREMPEARQRFLDEARIQARLLDHPNIVKVTNIVATPEHAALVMELIEGTSLETLVGTLTDRPDEVRRIMLDVLAAVEHAHQAGVIHRDLKPENVLLARAGGRLVARVTDFGIAKLSGGERAGRATHGGARLGTLPYMSPEQVRGARFVTPRSDVFSLGTMLYELATGELPFCGDDDFAVMDAIVHGRYVLPPTLPPLFSEVIATALQPDPDHRYASCARMAAALRGVPLAAYAAVG